MGIKRYYATKDNTITNAYKTNLSTRGVSGNMGQSDILEIFNIYGQVSSSADGLSSEAARILIQFNTDSVSTDRTNGTIPASGSVNFFLRLYDAEHTQTTPKSFTLTAQPLSSSWDEGLGLDMENYTDIDSSNWLYATDTRLSASASLLVESYNNSGQNIQLTGTNEYRFEAAAAFNDEGEFAIGGNNNACATNIYTIINASASADFSASVSADVVTIYAQPARAAGNSGTLSSSLSAFVTVTGSGDSDNGYLSASFKGGSDYTLWSTQGGDFLDDVSSSFSQSFDTGFENLEVDVTTLVEQWVNSAGNVLGSKTNYGFGLQLTGSEETGASSFYTKMFFARDSQYFHRRPVLEARWDSSKKDSRGDFLLSSSLVPASNNLMKLYLYNIVRGELTNIPGIGTDGDPIYISIYSGNLSNSAPTGSSSVNGTNGKLPLPVGGGVAEGGRFEITGSKIETGIYSCSFAYDSSSITKVFDVWYSGTVQYHTGAVIPVSTFDSKDYNFDQRYVSKITNLRSSYSRRETTRIRLYVRSKDWSPTIYSVSSNNIQTSIIDDAYYRIIRLSDSFEVIPYGTGSLNHTRLSYDTSGSYFDLKMDLFDTDEVYEMSFAYVINGSYVEQTERFRFRVE